VTSVSTPTSEPEQASDDRRWLSVLRSAAAVGAGLAWTLALPPWRLWWLGPVAIVLLGLAVRGLDARWRAALGGLTGLIVFGATLRWATIFTLPGYVVLVVVQAGFVALAAALVPRGRGWLVALPAAVTVAEWLRHQWPFSGLPVSSLALGQADGVLLPLAALGGPPLLTLAAATLGALVLGVLALRGRGRAAAAVGVALVLGAAMALPTGTGTTAAGPLLDVAAVQGGGSRGLPAAKAGTTDVLARHVRASADIRGGVDLVLWPENVVDVRGQLQGSPQAAAVSAVAEELEAPIVAGVTVDATPSPADQPGVRRFRNLAVTFGADGSIGPTYDKVVRVPFGEYVPFRAVVGRIADLSLIPREAVAGTGPGVLDTSVGRLGVLVSFEGLFAERARAAVDAGATALLVPTNASSYVTADVPDQQVAAARLRAVETGRWVVLAGPTGPAAIVDPSGTVLARSELEEQTVVEGRIQPRNGRTPYGVAGDLPVVLVAGTVLSATHMWRRVHVRRQEQ